MILFRKPADQEDGRQMSQNNHVFRAWMSDSFMDQRWGRRWGNKVKRPCNSCKYLLEWPLQSLHGWYEVEYFLSKPQTKMSHLPVIQASPRVNFWAHHEQQTGQKCHSSSWVSRVRWSPCGRPSWTPAAKVAREGLNSQKQIQCTFKINPSQLKFPPLNVHPKSCGRWGGPFCLSDGSSWECLPLMLVFLNVETCLPLFLLEKCLLYICRLRNI